MICQKFSENCRDCRKNCVNFLDAIMHKEVTWYSTYGRMLILASLKGQMKNQYFADINDYLKYGILRAIANSKLKICLCWMLTEDDNRNDGGKIKYLKDPDKWRKYDPALFDVMKRSVEKNKRSIDVSEKKYLIPDATYHPILLTDDWDEREQYFNELTGISAASDLIFFDADNGMEVKSVKKGNKNSSKYLYWDEVERFANTHSILVFQYFQRTNREEFIEGINQRLKAVSYCNGIDYFACRILSGSASFT